MKVTPVNNNTPTTTTVYLYKNDRREVMVFRTKMEARGFLKGLASATNCCGMVIGNSTCCFTCKDGIGTFYYMTLNGMESMRFWQ